MSRSHARRCVRHPDRVAKVEDRCAECDGRAPGPGEVARRLELVGFYETAREVRKGAVSPREVVGRVREAAGKVGEPVRSMRLALADDLELTGFRRVAEARAARPAVVSIRDQDRTALLRGKPMTVVWPAPAPPRDAPKAKRPDLVGESFAVDVRVLRQGGEEVDRFVVTCTDMADREDGDYDLTVIAGDQSDPVRLLVARHGVPVDRNGAPIDEDGDYTSVGLRALPNEMEAVSEPVQKAITAGQMQKFAELRVDRQEQVVRTARSRLQRLARQAKERGIDMTPELAEIQRQIEQAEARVSEAEEAMPDAA